MVGFCHGGNMPASDYNDVNDHDDDDDQVRSLAEWQEKKLSDLLCKPGPRIVLCRSLSF